MDAIVTNDNSERTTSCVALGPAGNRQGSVKCFSIETGRILYRRTVKAVPWPEDGKLIRKVEEWGKRAVRAIKRGCIKFLNRNGERFDWDNDDLSDLEVNNEQPKLTDPGVADIPVEDVREIDEPRKPTYVTRAVAARENAGLD